MKRQTDIAMLVSMLLAFWISPWCLLAQNAPSLEEQLSAQYDVGAVLRIQKEGILAVAPSSGKMCVARYQDGKLNPPDASCTNSLTNSSRPISVGEKVNPSKIEVDIAKETISFQIVECATCKKGDQARYQSQIDFQFGNGYLENANVYQIEDTIAEVLAFETGGEEQQSQPTEESQAGHGQANGSPTEVLTNSDVLKMTAAKLGDGTIIRMIKTSTCNFDTSMNAILQLKQQGVSEPVIQAMLDTKVAPTTAVEEPSNDAPAPDPNDPNASHDPGIYIYIENAAGKKMVLLEPTQYTQKTKSNVLKDLSGVYGIRLKENWRAEISNPKANTRVSASSVVFYFFMENGSAFSYGSVSLPNEFALLHLEVKKNFRESVGIDEKMFDSSVLVDKGNVSFTSTKIRSGVYKVTPVVPLTSGEYAFLCNKEMTAPGNRLFDFGVDPSK